MIDNPGDSGSGDGDPVLPAPAEYADSSSSPISSPRRRRTSSRTNIQSIVALLMGREVGGEGDSNEESSDATSDSEVATWPPLSRCFRPNKHVKPDPEAVRALDQSDFAQETKLRLETEKKGFESTPAMLGRCQLGGKRRRGACMFSKAERCKVLSRWIPSQKRQLAKFQQKMFCGTFSQCGNLFMSACQDQQIRIHDTSSDDFKLIREVRARNVGWSVLDTALSPDGRHLIYSSWCDYIHQVNIFGDEERHDALPLEPENGRFCLFSIRFSQDGGEILGGANDGFIYLFDREKQIQSLKINAHDDDVNAVSFVDSNTHILASGGDDGVCKIWDRRALRENDSRPVGVFAGHVDGITYVDPRGDGRHLITNGKDQCIKLWDLRRFSSEDDVFATRRAVGSQSWDYRWQSVPRHLARGNQIRSRYRCGESSCVMTYRGHTVLQTLIRCHFSPLETTGQRYIYTGCATGSVVVYDALTGEVAKELKGHKSCVRDVSWHPTKSEIISSSWDFTLAKWNYVPDNVTDEIFSEQKNSERCSRKRMAMHMRGQQGPQTKENPHGSRRRDDDSDEDNRHRLLD